MGITLLRVLAERCGHSEDGGRDLTASSGIIPTVAGECFDGGDRPPFAGLAGRHGHSKEGGRDLTASSEINTYSRRRMFRWWG